MCLHRDELGGFVDAICRCDGEIVGGSAVSEFEIKIDCRLRQPIHIAENVQKYEANRLVELCSQGDALTSV